MYRTCNGRRKCSSSSYKANVAHTYTLFIHSLNVLISMLKMVNLPLKQRAFLLLLLLNLKNNVAAINKNDADKWL